MKYRLLYTIIMLLLLATPAFSASTIQYEYDELDRLHAVTLENGQKITYEYDQIGNMISKTSYITISASVTGTGGSISPSGNTTMATGQSPTYTITPSTGYKIVNVYVDGVAQGAISSYTFSNLAANHTISANFSLIVNVADIGTISINSPGTYAYTFSSSGIVSVAYISAEGGAAGGFDYGAYESFDGADGGAAQIVYDGAIKATAYGGTGGIGCDRSTASGVSGGGTSSIGGTVEVGAGGLGEISGNHNEGGDGGNGGKISGGSFAVTAGKVIIITIPGNAMGNGSASLSLSASETGSITASSAGTYTHTFTSSCTVSVAYISAEGGAAGGYDYDNYESFDGADGGAAQIVYDGAIKATAYGGTGGIGSDGGTASGVSGGGTSSIGGTVEVGAGGPGEIAGNHNEGGNGGDGGKISGGSFAVTAGKVLTVTIPYNAMGNGSASLSWH